MAFDFHYNRDKYFQLQAANTRDNILPFIQKSKLVSANTRVLEIGARDGGVLLPFYELGCQITGFDLDKGPISQAKERYAEAIAAGKAQFFVMDVHDYIAQHSSSEEHKFDIILLKDVIEHVYGHREMIAGLKKILSKDGVIYFGFPPWHNPFGGHQQVLRNKFFALMPYYHLLPNFVYYNLIKYFCPESLGFIKATKETRITIEAFEKIVKSEGFGILQRNLYFISSMYRYKFNLKPRLQFKWLAGVPRLRNYFTTTCDYLISIPLDSIVPAHIPVKWGGGDSGASGR